MTAGCLPGIKGGRSAEEGDTIGDDMAERNQIVGLCETGETEDEYCKPKMKELQDKRTD